MKKHSVIASAVALAFGLVGCAPPADEAGEATAEETTEAVEEAGADAQGAVDGTMTGQADDAEGEGEAPTGVDEDGNPVQN